MNAWPQRCKICGTADGLDFGISDEIWHAVLGEEQKYSTACLPCFDKIASRKGISYKDAIRKELYFAGDGASLTFVLAEATESPSGLRKIDD